MEAGDREIDPHQEPPRIALSVSLLGSRDEFISPVDAIDMGNRPELMYFEIPGSGHREVLSLEGAGQDVERRRQLLKAAFTAEVDELARDRIRAEDIDDYTEALDIPVEVNPPSGFAEVRIGGLLYLTKGAVWLRPVYVNGRIVYLRVQRP